MVTNNVIASKVVWKVRAITGELNGPVKVSINVEEEEAIDEATGELKEELKVRTVLGFWMPLKRLLSAYRLSRPWCNLTARQSSMLLCIALTTSPMNSKTYWYC